MRKYGDERYDAQTFTLHCTNVERRGQWVDVSMALMLADGEALPDGLHEPSVLAICVPEGEVVQVVLLDEDCDCEFQFTPAEEQFVREYVREHCGPLVRSV